MKTVDKLQEISSRIDHLLQSADWIARESVHLDNTISQTGTLMVVLADEIREKVYDLIQEMEATLEQLKDCEIIH